MAFLHGIVERPSQKLTAYQRACLLYAYAHSRGEKEETPPLDLHRKFPNMWVYTSANTICHVGTLLVAVCFSYAGGTVSACCLVLRCHLRTTPKMYLALYYWLCSKWASCKSPACKSIGCNICHYCIVPARGFFSAVYELRHSSKKALLIDHVLSHSCVIKGGRSPVVHVVYTIRNKMRHAFLQELKLP